MSEISAVEFVPLLNHDDYEILNEYPFTIRKKKDKYELKDTYNNSNGYICITLNRKLYYKHRLISEQFIPNPNNLPNVDHVNHDRTDYHLSNLRWVSRSTNNFNKSSHLGVEYTFYDDIPDESICITDYQTRNGLRVFNVNKYYYYYDEDENEDMFFMKVDDHYYRKIHVNVFKNGLRFIRCRDINHKGVSVYINQFKLQYNLI